MKKTKISEKGITLIALVITIIILLILAGVTINIVFNDGLIEKSQKAADEYIAEQQNEEKLLDYINKTLITEVNNLNGKENKKMIEDIDYSYYNPVVPVGFKTVNTGGANWRITEDKELGYIVSGWNDGLVIEDEDGNQFVWVPAQLEGENINGVVEYVKWLGAENYYKNEEGDFFPSIEESVESDKTPVDENAQIEKYHGFYIARYEAGIPESMIDLIENYSKRNTEGVPVSKKNQVPWNGIDYTTAQANAESMYSTNNVQSGLVTGTMWDTIMKWLESTNELTKQEVEEDSQIWGNYKDSPVTGITWYSPYGEGNKGTIWTKLKIPTTKLTSGEAKDTYWILRTGNTEYTKRKNIYDLAGNMWEWTNENLISEEYPNRHIKRGGSLYDSGTNRPAALRSHDEPSTVVETMSFRVVLYIL